MLLSVLLGLLLGLASAIPTISTKGAKFFTSDGDQFFIKGVAYQLLPQDPLVDNTQCTLDANLMKTLGANSIRVYHVDPQAKHDDCMKTFADAGIYIWLDMDTFDTYIEGPGMSAPQWNESQYKAYQGVMDAFHNYDNLAGFFVGNEVLTSPDTDIAAPFVKAAARDMKAYRDKKGYRKIPIGYTGADVASLRPMLQNYLACGNDSADAVDFYGLNAYEWCGQATYDTSGYVFLQQNASDYNIPIFFSETGCNAEPPRTFDDQAAIFGDKMANTWSGAIIYEWIQETNMYGLVSYPVSGDSASAASGAYGVSGTPTPISPDFENLSKHWATLSPTGVSEADYKPSLAPPPCPAYTSGAWQVSPDAPLPTIGEKAVSVSESSSVSATSTGTATATGKAQPEESSGAGTGSGAASAGGESTSGASESSQASPTSGASLGAMSLSFGGSFLGLASLAWMSAAICGMAGFLLVL